MKRIWSVVLALALMLSLMPMGAFGITASAVTPDVGEGEDYGTVTESGTCGDNLIWTLYDSGTLVISGEGAMEDYDIGDAPWVKLDFSNVIIGDSVTSIGNNTFRDCTSLTSVTIPDSVVSIGDGAFYNCTYLISVTIPNSVMSIGNNAFRDCTSLTSVTIPDSVTSIGDRAFSYCDSLTSVTIGNSVMSIGDHAFDWCTSLTLLTIGNSVTCIGEWAFYSCTSLMSITVEENNPNYCSVDGVLFSKDKTVLYTYPAGKAASSYTIPEGVTSIGVLAFSDCTRLTSITIPDSVASIGAWAFDGCANLTSITIPDSVTRIEDCTFGDCDRLTSVTIGSGVTSIGVSAFIRCDSLTSITIPDGVTSIEDNAFWDCQSLVSITIPSSVTSIGSTLFMYDVKIYGYAGSYAETYAVENDIPFVALDEEYTITVDETLTVEIVGGWVTYIEFIPTVSGTYTFSSDANVDTYGYLYDANKNQLTYDDDSGESYNFSITYDLEAGVTYYWGARYYDWERSGSFDVLLVYEEVDEPVVCDHIYDNACDADCNECGDIRTVGEHTYDNSCDAECNNCGTVRIPADHVYDNAYDADCNECGAVREIVQDAPAFVVVTPSAYVYAGDTFTVTVNTKNNPGIVSLKVMVGYDADVFELVSINGQDFGNISFGSLTNNPIAVNWIDARNPNNETDGVVAVLTFRVWKDAVEGDTAITLSYDPEDVYDYDFNNVTFATVNGTINVTKHTYDNACDTVCNVCGAVRVIEHTYDNACDTVCNLCGATRVIEHTYNNACDATCNVCGDVRTVGAHLYDNDSDKQCNHCGHTRTVTPVSVAVGTLPNKTVYAPGEALNTAGLSLLLTYRDGSTERVSNGYSVSGYNPAKLGAQTLTVSYKAFAIFFDIMVSIPVVDEGAPAFVVGTSGGVYPGDTFTVTVNTKNNPGIVSLMVDVGYDADVLELISVNGKDFSGTSFGPLTKNPIAVNWYDSLNPNNTTNGVVAVLTFKVREDAAFGDTVITLSHDPDNVYDYDFENVTFANVSGCVEILCPHVNTAYHPRVASTCITQGTMSYTFCYDCQTIIAGSDEKLPLAAHVYDNACDADCNTAGCGVTRVPADHVYNNACDADCNICGDTRIPADHVYDHACDTDCNECGDVRVTEHTYDNACDAVCNVCGNVRTVGEHVYDNDGDRSCNICGHVRVVTPVSAELNTLPDKVVYAPGEALDTAGLTLLLTYGDGTPEITNRGYSVSGYNPYTLGAQTVTVIYEAFTILFDITVSIPVIDEDAPAFVANTPSGPVRTGDTFTVTVNIKNNPGIVSLMVDVGYDADVFELISVNGKDFSGALFGPLTNNPIAVNWIDTLNPNNETDGVVAVLSFKVREDATLGDTAITLSYNPNDVYDYDFENVEFASVSGAVRVVDYFPGDVDGDGYINNKDFGLLQRYIIGWDIGIHAAAGDVNGDGLLNNKDLGLLQRYINGWDVELK